MDPLDFALRNMVRSPPRGGEYTNYSLEQCLLEGAEAFGWEERHRSEPGSDPGPIKRGAGMGFMVFRSGLGRSSAIIELNGQGQYTLFVGVTDVGGGAKTTMHMIAAEALGVPRSRVDLVSGDTDRCPYSVGESGSRTTIMTGQAILEAVQALEQKIAEQGLPTGDEILVADATPTPRMPPGLVRQCFGAHFCEVEVDTELGSARVLKYLAVHESGRIMNPLAATSQIKGGVVQGIGQALRENLIYDARSGQPLTAGYYGDRVPTSLDAPEVDVTFIETDDGYGPYGAKSVGESGILPAPAAVANAVSNALGHRMKDLPITRDKILEALS
jgi:xanthine dehydrogenase YagR molybdenum-binding subunit